MPATLSARSSWSLYAMCLLPAVLAEVGAIGIAAAAGGAVGWPVLGMFAVVAIGTVLLIVRLRMPAGAKAAQIGAVIFALLVLVASQDAYGLRAVSRRLIDASAANGLDAPPMVSSAGAGTPATAFRASGSAEGAVVAALSESLEGALPPFAPRIDATVAIDEVAGLRHTTMTWSLARGEARRWCGRVRVSGTRDDLVIEQFRAAILAAVTASGPEKLVCF